jgi:hypothetical protein
VSGRRSEQGKKVELRVLDNRKCFSLRVLAAILRDRRAISTLKFVYTLVPYYPEHWTTWYRRLYELELR